MSHDGDRDCALCTEPMYNDPGPEFGNWAFHTHRACALRSAVGGIGHLIAHEYWCLQKHDPDAGLTYRQSALLVDELVTIIGVEATIARGKVNGPSVDTQEDS